MYEIFGPYQLIERLASGGMAEIFKARTFGHSGFEKTLVIKRLHPRYTQTPEFVEMLKDEAKIAVGLSHANIVQIFDLGRVQEHYYIAMEYINGRDLNQLMNRVKEQRIQIPAEAALYITSEVCAGLDFAHRQRDMNGRLLRLIHRDVSPQNIMISLEGGVKIVDFGIAKSLASQQETEAGVIKGKFCFMSPEQARGQKLDHRTDIFSAGIMLYELLTGQAMYENADDHQLLQQVRNAQITPIESLRPDLPKIVHKVVNRVLARDRDQRYPSARHFQHALEKVMQKSGLMFSRFQLGQTFSAYFPQLTPNHDDILDTYDGFENDELSLITDYEAQNIGRGDWEVPEFTDEIEELDLEEIEFEESTDAVNAGHEPSSGIAPFSRNSVPIAVSGSPNHINYAPAAPPPRQQHLYDPKYDSPKPSALGVAGHAQVTQPPQGHQVSLNDHELYSGEMPPVAQIPSRQVSSTSGHFLDQVDSTMILDDEGPSLATPTRRPLSPRDRVQRRSPSNQWLTATQDLLQKSGRSIKYWINDPKGKYVVAALGFFLVFTLAQVLKKQFFTPSQKAPVAVQLGQTNTPATVVGMNQGVGMPQTQAVAQPFRGQSKPQRLAPVGVSKRQVNVSRTSLSPQNQYPKAIPPVMTSQGFNAPSNSNLGQRGVEKQAQQGTAYPNRFSNQQSNINHFEAPQKQMVNLRITTDPPNAEIAINDEWQQNTTPVSVQVPQGEMMLLTFSKEGFEERREKVWPQVNNPQLKFDLEPHLGHLIINTTPDNVTITQDGKRIGKTPYEREDFSLKPTEFRIELSKSGYISKAYRMSWLNADRGTLELDATLVKKERPKSRAKPKARARKSSRKPKSRARSSRPSGRGYLSVKASRWGHLFVDNRFVKEGKIVLKHRVSSGRHRIKFCFEGDRGNCAQKSISVSNGAHEKVFF